MRATLADFERPIGFDRRRVVHDNDSKRPCGSRVDRQGHIVEGFVGLEGFGLLVNDRRFATMPMLLEIETMPVRRATDVTADPMDAENLRRLRSPFRLRRDRR